VNRLLVVVGARPNFVKVAPVLHALRDSPLEVALLHTGQHYDHALYGSFLEQLDMPSPDFHLGVGSGTHAEQTAGVMVGCERVLLEHGHEMVLVPGDVNSALGAALAAVKLGVAVIHLESGLRSGDWTMPEEVNRVLTDRLSALLLCHSQEAISNLAMEGIAGEHVQLVGNTMIDSLLRLHDSERAREVVAAHGLELGGYLLVTLHRPATVDDAEQLAATVEVLGELAEQTTIVFPVHPRTRKHLAQARLPASDRLRLLDPLGYLDFIALQSLARLVITDSGGVQEETSALGVPCVTYRTTTERPVTVTLGTNELVGLDPVALLAACRRRLAEPSPDMKPAIPLWDGAAGERAASAIRAFSASRLSS
jgi:UDP-N-acetylglucosamine 2-epimerase (non-hydrolysing)